MYTQQFARKLAAACNAAGMCHQHALSMLVLELCHHCDLAVNICKMICAYTCMQGALQHEMHACYHGGAYTLS